MLTRLIVSTYKGIAELAIWVWIGIGAFAGFQIGNSGGNANGMIGMVIGAVAMFFFIAIFLGAALLLAEIHSSLQRIETKLKVPREQTARSSAPFTSNSDSEKARRRALGYDD